MVTKYKIGFNGKYLFIYRKGGDLNMIHARKRGRKPMLPGEKMQNVACRLPPEVIAAMDEFADRNDRSFSWVMRKSVMEFLIRRNYQFDSK